MEALVNVIEFTSSANYYVVQQIHVCVFLVYKAFVSLAPRYLCKLIIRPLSEISDRLYFAL